MAVRMDRVIAFAGGVIAQQEYSPEGAVIKVRKK